MSSISFIFSILISISSSFNVMNYHPLHVSVCEINHKAEKEWLEITIKIFADDFQDVLEDRTGINTKLGTEEEHIQANGFIYDYLKEKIKLKINDEIVSLQFVGKEVENLVTWCYLYVPNVNNISSIEISNAVMLHWFNDQINVTHIDCNDQLRSTFFSKDRAVEKFEY